ncbi:hypothetical protein LY78DRAFT_445570 [Colletotrichum sublineola]|nr:hypothetical protein LY78DRAFT_445570 [Colletotrichum sublineola]
MVLSPRPTVLLRCFLTANALRCTSLVLRPLCPSINDERAHSTFSSNRSWIRLPHGHHLRPQTSTGTTLSRTAPEKEKGPLGQSSLPVLAQRLTRPLIETPFYPLSTFRYSHSPQSPILILHRMYRRQQRRSLDFPCKRPPSQSTGGGVGSKPLRDRPSVLETFLDS